MSSVERGTGSTDSERVLAQIAERSFLDLWTYPNLYREQKINGSDKSDGKELCDLLVVCGDNVLIFSDKVIKWYDDKPIDVAWSRWYKKAVDASVKQIRGAERWLREFPDRIYLDKECTKPLPIDLPPLERLRSDNQGENSATNKMRMPRVPVSKGGRSPTEAPAHAVARSL